MENIHMKKPGEKEWQLISSETAISQRFDWGLPRNWVLQLNRGNVIFADDVLLKRPDITEPHYNDSVELEETILFNNFQNNEWEKRTEKDIEMILEMMGNYASHYKSRLQNGEIISFPLCQLKLENTNVCPICGLGFRGMGALSRRDNETEICSDCGDIEAFQDLERDLDVPLTLSGVSIGNIPLRLYDEVMKWSPMPMETILLEWAYQDFDKDIETKEDVASLDKLCRDRGYDSILEWVKEHMRNRVS
jgi:hypothetical protein